MYRKNVAGQNLPFALVNAATGAALTGATVTARRSIDGGAQASATGTVSELANGQYNLALSQADTNGNHIGILLTATNAIPAHFTLVTTAADPTDAVRLGLTSLPNAAAEAAGGLYTRGSGAGQINQPANGMVDTNTVRLGGVAQSLTDLKDFADDGYDPSTNKVQGVVLTDTVTTYTGNTPQTGDAFARLGAPAGASVSADIAAIEAQTDDIGAAGAGLTAVPWNAAWDAEVQSEVEDALIAHRLDELLNADSDIDGAAPPAVGSVFHELMTKTTGSFTYDQTTDSLEAIRDSSGGGPTAAQVADAVWDEARADHLGAGSFGEAAQVARSGTAQAGSGTTVTLDAGASAVDDFYNTSLITIVSGTGAGQTRAITDYAGATKVATVNNWFTQPDSSSVFVILPFGAPSSVGFVAGNVNGGVVGSVGSVAGNVAGNVAGSVGSVSTGGITAASIATNAIDADALAPDAVTEIQSGLSTLTAAQVNAEVDTAIADARLDELLAADSDIDGAAPPAVGSVFHELMTKTTGSFTYDQTTDSLEAIRDSGGGGLTAQQVADAVWDEPVADHLDSGSTGEALNAAGAAGDPWVTALPGAYGAGSAGNIIGNNLNATVGSRATQASVDAIDDFLDTEVAAILADTNELQTDWADGGRLDNILDARATQASVDAVDDFLDTEVAAILADTNELQTDWANGGRLDNLLDARASQTSVDDLPTNAELATALSAADDAVLAAVAGVQSDTNDIQSRLPAALVAGRMAADAVAISGATAAADAVEASIGNLDAAVSSRAAAAALTTVSGLVDDLETRLTAGRAANLDNLDQAVSSRLADADYTPPPTATENADALLKRDMAAVSGEASRSPLNALRILRNRHQLAAGTLTVYAEDDTTAKWTAAATTDAAAEPITQIDPG